jgi:hypothetical protein
VDGVQSIESDLQMKDTGRKQETIMKFLNTFLVMLGLGFTLSASAKTLTTDPLTGLPLYPATDSRLHLGNEPTKIPDSQICKSKMQSDFYSIFDTKVDVTVAWYTAHLAGFHKAHVFANERSQDTFYNDAGTVIVSVTGSRGKDGENTDAYSVSYHRFDPGLPVKTIIGFTQAKIVCQ